MTMQTYADVLGAHDIEVPAHLARDMEIPVLSGLQVQGDVAVIPVQPVVVRDPKSGVTTVDSSGRFMSHVATKVPPEGVAVVRGENGGNTHLLIGEGVLWAPETGRAGEQDLGLLTVPEGVTAFLLHPEHGANAMAPGNYVLRRQCEQADEIRLVAD